MKKNEPFRGVDLIYGSTLTTNKNIYSSTFEDLDRILPDGGWPRVGITEILIPTIGANVLRLLLPALAEISKKRWVVLVSPPYTPFSLAWEQAGADVSKILVIDLPESDSRNRTNTLWAYEQALRFDGCGAALFWGDEMSTLELRKLYRATEIGNTWGIIFRSAKFANYSSPASLRIQLDTLPLSKCHLTSNNLSSIKFKGTIIKGSSYSMGQQFLLEI
jgi:cell division inhibitor SulA